MRCPFGRLRRRQVHPFLLERLRVVKHAGHRIVSLASDVQAASAGCVPATRRSAALPHLHSNRSGPLMAYLALLVAYSAAQIALGLWIGRRVQHRRRLLRRRPSARPGPDLLDDARGEHRRRIDCRRDGSRLPRRAIAAWWWVGSAAIGSIVLALWIGPAMRRVAAAHDLRTVGDFLEFRYGVGRPDGDRRAALGRRRSSSSRGS